MSVPPSQETEGQQNPFAPPTGEPGPYGYYPNAAVPRPAVLNPQRQRLVWLKVSLSLVVLVVCLGLLFFGDSIFSSSPDVSSSPDTSGEALVPRPLGAGDCLTIDRVGIPCISPFATTKIALTVDTGKACPDPAYQELAASHPNREVCVLPNVHENDCVAISGGTHLVKADCTAPDSTLLVTKMLDGVADVGQCTSPRLGFAYSRPATTICVGPLPKPS